MTDTFLTQIDEMVETTQEFIADDRSDQHGPVDNAWPRQLKADVVALERVRALYLVGYKPRE